MNGKDYKNSRCKGMRSPITLLLLVFLFPLNLFGEIIIENSALIMNGGNYSIAFDAFNGSIRSLNETGKSGPLFKSGANGLWFVRFIDGTEITADNFKKGNGSRSFSYTADSKSNGLTLFYNAPEITVTVSVKGNKDAIDFSAEVEPSGGTVLDFAVPDTLLFEPDLLERFIYPAPGNGTVGIALKSGFFKQQPESNPTGWETRLSGPNGYIKLYGSIPVHHQDNDPPVWLQITDEGKKWFEKNLIERLSASEAVVNRPPKKSQADIVLIDSTNGPYFSAKKMEAGFIWRIGGAVSSVEKQNVLDAVTAVIEKIAVISIGQRSKLGVISLQNGPPSGGWTAVKVNEWIEKLETMEVVRTKGVSLVKIRGLSDLAAALKGNDYCTILNPYGEYIPARSVDAIETMMDSIREYIEAGGNWFEVSAHPFYYALQPLRYFRIESKYPNAFADFMHLDSRAGAASLFGIQPQKWKPWEGSQNPSAVFVPGVLSCGGKEQGGFFRRLFATYIEPGATWHSPAVRLSVGKSAPEDVALYCGVNEIKRPLKDKMNPEILEKLKRSVLVYYAGDCGQKTAALNFLPVPSLIHFADYLKGGFDKQYPDHLPPNPGFGSPEEFRAFIDRAHDLGHLVMPYTNPTWWCDGPKGPTFIKEGEGPLLKDLQGRFSYERYSQNYGYTITHWHPAVQKANRATIRAFTDDYPVDVLFQDQCGARSWVYDTNPSSPTAYAYTDGLISMIAEDSMTRPLSTEDGWDRVVNYESQLCGIVWRLIPTEPKPAFIPALIKDDYPASLWEIFPLAEYIAHDKVLFNFHDLGMFVTGRKTLPWALGLGYGMSYRVSASELSRGPVDEWLKWLDRIQKSIGYRYSGVPLKAFEHVRGENHSPDDDGVIHASYGKLSITANLSTRDIREGGFYLPPFGYLVSGPGILAANVKKLGGLEFGEEGIDFIVDGNVKKADIWIYALQGQGVRIKLPFKTPATVTIIPERGKPEKLKVSKGITGFTLPYISAQVRIKPPEDLIKKAPRDIKGLKPSIGILDFKGVSPAWTKIMPAEWIKAFKTSKVLADSGVQIMSIKSAADLTAALRSGWKKWLCIVNPYGEIFPVSAPGRWKEMLDNIGYYVGNGGTWWETGGYSFYTALTEKSDGQWEPQSIGPEGTFFLSIPVGSGEVNQSEEPLHATAEGRAWLGKALSGEVDSLRGRVNRSLPSNREDPGHVTLVAGLHEDYIGGYRLNGWGWLFRTGGFNPNPDVLLPVAVASIEYIFTHPPVEAKVGGRKYLWHYVVRR
ncbi:MAG: hypothetical protein JW969_21385 [Spirochaetales bacterium]|nr:hypothetical protein [Spirochaetales bacterium]